MIEGIRLAAEVLDPRQGESDSSHHSAGRQGRDGISAQELTLYMCIDIRSDRIFLGRFMEIC